MYDKKTAAVFQAAREDFNYWTTRAESQLKFAGRLCAYHPEKSAAWKPLITRAAELVREPAAAGSAGLAPAVKAAEARLAPLAACAKKYRVYCVGHAHIDMNWMWGWPETVAVTNDTFETMLRLLDEFPAFRFSQSQASTYAIIEKYHPALLNKIARQVARGRWEVTASHWVECDKNMSGDEALCRHLLYTRRYLQKLFGLKPADIPIDWSPDTFGHALTSPTYLAQGGVKYLYLHRPGTHGPRRPPAFRWQAPDGAVVLVKNDMEVGYNGMISPAVADQLDRFKAQTGLPFTLLVYGVGDHGGGPTRSDILCALDLHRWPVFPAVTFSTALEFFQRLEREGAALPVLTGELNTENTGCYTTQTLIKKTNRLAENRLVDVEKTAGLVAQALGRKYPADQIEQAWRDTLFSHFHDILPGSGVHDTRTYTHGLFQQTMATVQQLGTRALRSLAAGVDTGHFGAFDRRADRDRNSSALGAGVGFRAGDFVVPACEQGAGGGPRPFLVFNPSAWDRAEMVEFTVWDGGQQRTSLTTHRAPRDFAGRPFTVVDARGARFPAQVIDWGHYWGHHYARLAFPVMVPGLGYQTFAVLEDTAAEVKAGVAHLGATPVCSYIPAEHSPEGLENDRVRFELDPAGGGIRSLVDKKTGAALIRRDGTASLLEYIVEKPHGMTAWCMDHPGPAERPRVAAITRALDGPYRCALDVKLHIRASVFTVRYELRAGDPKLYLFISGTWFQRGTPETGVPSLRLALPLNLKRPITEYEIPFGSIRRDLPGGQEVPALNWVQVAGLCGGKKAALVLLNDSKYGYSLQGQTLRCTLVRGSYDPDPLPEIGEHSMAFALLPSSGACCTADAVRRGKEFNHPLQTAGTGVHAGRLPSGAQFMQCSAGRVIVNSVRHTGAPHTLVLRAFNPAARGEQTEITFNQGLLGTLAAAEECDLNEMQVVRRLPHGKKGLKIRVPAFGLMTVRVRFSRRSG